MGGLAAAGIGAGAAAAAQDSIDDQERARVLHSEKVSRLYEAVGSPAIQSSNGIQAQNKKVDASVYRFQTTLGELRQVSLGGTTIAQFIFDSGETQPEKEGATASKATEQEASEEARADIASATNTRSTCPRPCTLI